MKTEWIRVEDRLPERRHFVLVYERILECIFECYIDENGIWWYAGTNKKEYGEVTHWSVLPEPPERTEE